MNTLQIASIADVRKAETQPYAHFMAHASVFAALEAASGLYSERTALTAIDVPEPVAPVRRWTYAQFLRQTRQAANLFNRLSDGAQPRVALLLPPIPEAHFALWGAETSGIACPINFQLNDEHIAALLIACKANIVVAMGPAPGLEIWPRVATIVAQCPDVRHVLAVGGGEGTTDFATVLAAEDGDTLHCNVPGDVSAPAALFHTGGTTGAPKLALHTQGNQLHAAWGAAQMFGTTANDVVLNGFPLFHVAGTSVYGLSTLLAGGEIVLPTRLGLRNTEFMAHYGSFVERFGVTFIAAVPTVIASLLALELNSRQLSSVRALLTGGSPLPTELAAMFEQRHGIPVRNILGMTESAGVISIEPLAGPRTPGSCGLPLPYTEVKALRVDGTDAPPMEPGILRVRGPNVIPGYTEAARNAGTFEGDWLITGDIGHIDHAGRVFVTGRSKDVIIRGAHNIDPGMIESALLRHPDVLMAAAVGEPDEYAGELPIAFVSLKPGATASAAQILAFALPHIPERPAVPKRIDILPTIPVTAVGKVYKPALRVLAIRRLLLEKLAAAGLGEQVQLQVEETPSGMAVHFAADEGDEAGVRSLMKPFAIGYTIARKEETLS
jgi:fatty-acyl-CoA synthase